VWLQPPCNVSLFIDSRLFCASLTAAHSLVISSHTYIANPHPFPASAAFYRFDAVFRIALHCQHSYYRRIPKIKWQSAAFDCYLAPATISAAFATLLYALSPLVWFYSIQAEVFALNNAFVAV
jgi:hypothetical protein